MYLVIGSTGAVGSRVTRLLAQKRRVAALVRDVNSDTAKSLQAAGATLVLGDLKDRLSIEKAVTDMEGIICTASSTMSRREGDSIETVDHQGIQTVIHVAIARSVPAFIYISFSRNISDHFPLAQAKRAAEQRLEQSNLGWTILLPSYFAETWLSPAVGFDVGSGKVKIYGTGKAKVSYISLEDVAKAVTACLDNAKASKQAIPIGGPRAYSQLEAVALVEEATGKRMQLEYMTDDEIKAARAATSDPMTASFLGLFAALAKGDEISTSWTSFLNVNPVSLEEWVRKRFAVGSRG